MLDHDKLADLFEAMLRDLEGDWLLVGGALTALWLADRRVTEDIDMVGLDGTQEERLRLMRFARSQGLPVETVNSAVEFYLYELDGWRDALEIFRESDGVRIYRPNPTLFLLLKVNRLSEQDLSDCMALLDRVAEDGLDLDRDRVVRAVEGLSPPEGSGLEQRARQLLSRLDPDAGVVVDLGVIIDSLDIQSDLATSYLDRTAGKFFVLTEDDRMAADWDEPLEDFPDWQREDIERAREIEGGSDRYVALPDQYEIHEYRALDGFASEHPDPEISDALLDAIGGRGAFRRFKDTVFELGVQEEWNKYRRAFLERIARLWCEENQIPYRTGE